MEAAGKHAIAVQCRVWGHWGGVSNEMSESGGSCVALVYVSVHQSIHWPLAFAPLRGLHGRVKVQSSNHTVPVPLGVPQTVSGVSQGPSSLVAHLSRVVYERVNLGGKKPNMAVRSCSDCWTDTCKTIRSAAGVGFV